MKNSIIEDAYLYAVFDLQKPPFDIETKKYMAHHDPHRSEPLRTSTEATPEIQERIRQFMMTQTLYHNNQSVTLNPLNSIISKSFVKIAKVCISEVGQPSLYVAPPKPATKPTKKKVAESPPRVQPVRQPVRQPVSQPVGQPGRRPADQLVLVNLVSEKIRSATSIETVTAVLTAEATKLYKGAPFDAEYIKSFSWDTRVEVSDLPIDTTIKLLANITLMMAGSKLTFEQFDDEVSRRITRMYSGRPNVIPVVFMLCWNLVSQS
jgi:hypothetical protein